MLQGVVVIEALSCSKSQKSKSSVALFGPRPARSQVRNSHMHVMPFIYRIHMLLFPGRIPTHIKPVLSLWDSTMPLSWQYEEHTFISPCVPIKTCVRVNRMEGKCRQFGELKWTRTCFSQMIQNVWGRVKSECKAASLPWPSFEFFEMHSLHILNFSYLLIKNRGILRNGSLNCGAGGSMPLWIAGYKFDSEIDKLGSSKINSSMNSVGGLWRRCLRSLPQNRTFGSNNSSLPGTVAETWESPLVRITGVIDVKGFQHAKTKHKCDKNWDPFSAVPGSWEHASECVNSSPCACTLKRKQSSCHCQLRQIETCEERISVLIWGIQDGCYRIFTHSVKHFWKK